MYTFDQNHSYQYIIQQEEGAIEFIHNASGRRFHDTSMLEELLNAYDLNLQSIKSLDEFDSHIQQIHRKYAAQPESIKLRGIEHLLKQKDQNIHFPHEARASKLEDNQPLQEDNLPLVTWITCLLKQDDLKKRYQKSLNHTILVIVEQGFSTVTQVISAITELGFPAQNLILYTKAHTSVANLDTFKQLQIKLGFHHFCINNASDIRQDRSNLHEIELNLMTKVSETVEQILKNNHEIFHLAVHDEGGKLLNSPFFRDKLARNYSHLTFSSSEHTMSGLNTQKENVLAGHLGLPGPRISMASCFVKANKESFLIADASFATIKPSLEEIIEKPGQPIIAVVGIGNIGSIFVEFLIRHYGNKIKLVLVEKEGLTEKLKHALSLAMEHNVQVETQQFTTPELLTRADMLFGCSGQDITKDLEIPASPNPHNISLFSLSSGQREFKSLLEQRDYDQEERDFVRHSGKLIIRIKNYGEPIIFNGRKDGVEPIKIQLTRALTISTVFQQLAYLSVVQSIKASPQATLQQTLAQKTQQRDLIKLDAGIQVALWNAFCKFYRKYPQHHENPVSATYSKIWENFLQSESSVRLFDKGSQGISPHCCLNFFGPHNAIKLYDKNHTLHLVYNQDQLELVFEKHGQWVNDPHMLESLIGPDLLKKFYALSSGIDIIDCVEQIIRQIQGNPDFQPMLTL